MADFKWSRITFPKWQVLILALVLLIALVASLYLPDRLSSYLPETVQLPSIFNKKVTGTAGFYDLTRMLGMKSTIWGLPYRALNQNQGNRSARRHGILVIFGPTKVPAEFEVDDILQWVEEGNDLVYFDWFSYKFEQRLAEGLKLEFHHTKPMFDERKANTNLPVFEHARHLAISANSRIEPRTDITSLCQDKDGILIGEIKCGQGKILIGCDPLFVANGRLANKDYWANFQFMANWLAQELQDNSKVIMFDERCHGYSSVDNVLSFIMRSPAGYVIYQLLLLLLLILIGASQRFGAAESLTARRPISNMAFVEGLKNTYRRAHANRLAAEVIGHAFRARLAKSVASSTKQSNTTLARLASQTYGIRESELSNLLARLTDFERSDFVLSDSELLAYVNACDNVTTDNAKTRQ